MRLLLVLLLLAPGLAVAETTRATFDIYVSGIRSGVISVAGEERGGRYATAGRLESVGVVGAFRRVRYDAEVRGRVSGVDFRPERYSETFLNRGERDRKSIAYRGGVPRVTADDERDDDDLDPATQGGTIDPLTAIWGLLRDVRLDQACRFAADLFDGARRSRVSLGTPVRSAERITCDGEYRRIAGYDPETLAEKARFPFRVTYRPVGGGTWQVERIDMDTIFGRGVLIRR